eukprot:1193659-Prorocentrum_minimum.AAC.4
MSCVGEPQLGFWTENPSLGWDHSPKPSEASQVSIGVSASVSWCGIRAHLENSTAISPAMTEYEFESHKDRKLTILTFKDVTNSGSDVGGRVPNLCEGTFLCNNPTLDAQSNATSRFDWVKFVTIYHHATTADMTTIPDVTPVIAAANKALFSQSRGKLVTRTIYSEMIFNVSGSKHITETLKRWGISESSTGLIVAKFDTTPAELQIFRDSVKGVEIDNDAIGQLMDLKATKKAYHITDPELQVGSLTDAILMRIAVRDCS